MRKLFLALSVGLLAVGVAFAAPGAVRCGKLLGEAHKLGRKVAAHVHGTQSIKDAIRAGIDSIEHSSLIDDEGIALVKQRGTYPVFDNYNDDFILQGPQGPARSPSPSRRKRS
jgi:imidazolonepropionase-like amidohydrolase